MANPIRSGRALLLCAGMIFAACTARHEQETRNSAKRVDPVMPADRDAGQSSSGLYLSVLLRFEAGAVVVEKLNRVRGALHPRRGQRQRRGLLLIAEDTRGNAVYRDVIPDPRPGQQEYVGDARVLHRAPGGSGPQYALVRVPVTARRLVIRDALHGALDGKPSEAESEPPAAAPPPDAYPLIATLELEAP